eukprot:TRINITY_DN178_c5_g1_i1.p1 TRINITY_DN178_c5_g1~~TRINITY_DN178_c5_g1_i1.p1  ORF type:complete len:430 (-),score=117.61 TRINITY_DN178_c5_g1_i1:116-1405(-)
MAKKPSPKDYEWNQVLGEGAFGDVVLATEKKTGDKFAVKKMLKVHLDKESSRKFVMNERNALSKISHPNIVKLYSAFRDDDFFYYVLNLASNGELLSHIRRHKGLNLDCIRFYTAECIMALEYLHTEVGIIHRDLKPENILIDEKWHLLLTDFGTCKLIDKEELKSGREARRGSFVGTPEYMSPELVKDTKTCYASDLWALGCSIYQMICARPPFRGVTEYMTMKKVQEGLDVIVYPDPFPDIAKDLIERLLQMNPTDRLGSRNYNDLKTHPFFGDTPWSTLGETTPPAFGPYPQKLVWQEDIIREEKERLERERKELNEKWRHFLHDDEQIIESGNIIKKRKMTRKKRFLMLTDTPRILYVDPKKMEFKGEVPWDFDPNRMKTEIKTDTLWKIITPKRVYDLEDLQRNSDRWKEAIEKCQTEMKGEKK